MDKLQTNGKVVTKEGREFTRLMCGFGENKPMFTIWQAGELLGQETRVINGNFERNRAEFEIGVDFIDLKSLNTQNVKTKPIDVTGFLKDVGYSQNKLNATKKWLVFSFSGLMKICYISERIISEDMQKIINEYFYIDKSYFVKVCRKEMVFGNMLESVFKDIFDVEKQYFCDDFMIDFYLPQIKLAVEYDEDYHKHQLEKDKNREKKVRSKLGCDFIRVREGFELKGLNEIIKYIKQMPKEEKYEFCC